MIRYFIVTLSKVIRVMYLVFACLYIFACSSGNTNSGGEGTTRSGGIEKITINELSFSHGEFYEGEIVEISLSATGEGSEDLQYNWSVEGDIEFQGQNTGTITFIAPEVSGPDWIDIRVELSLKNGTLLGQSNQRGSIQILDTSPPQILTPGLTTTLPMVDALDLSELSSRWLAVTYEHFNMDVVGQLANVQRVSRFSVKVNNAELEPGVSICGGALSTAISLSDFIGGATAESFGCDLNQWEKRLYQENNQFRVENRCDDRVVFARNFTQLQSGLSSFVGSVAVNEDDFGVFQDVGDACMSIIEASVSYYDETITSPMKYVVAGSTRLTLEVPQPEGPVIFDFVGDAMIGGFNNFRLGDFFNENNLNALSVIAPSHDQIHLKNPNGGSVFVHNTEDNVYEIDLDLQFELENDPRASLDIEAIINML